MVGFTNPKAYVIFAAVLPQFVDRDRGHGSLQMLLLGLDRLRDRAVLGQPVGAAWPASCAAGSTPPRQRGRALGTVGGMSMIGLGVAVAVGGPAGHRMTGHEAATRRSASSPRLGGERHDVRRGSARRRPSPAAQRARWPARSCPTFPADNYWHADIRKLPVDPRSKQWLSHMSTGGRPAPRLRPVVRARSQLRHPDHRRRRQPPEGAGALPATPARATRCATRSAPTPGSRAGAARRRPARDHRRQGRCRLYETFATREAQRAAGTPARARSGR